MGDRAGYISSALTALKGTSGVLVREVSAFEETKPIGPIKQPDFINAVAKIETTLDADELLDVLLGIEQNLCRVRKERWGPRTIDLDILLYGNKIINHPKLQVPHPEIQNRPFILEALRELGVYNKITSPISGDRAHLNPCSAPSPGSLREGGEGPG